MKNSLITEFLQSRIDAKDFPSAVYLVAEKGQIIFTDALGYAVVEPEKIEAKIDTIYDLASLTKVLVTGLLCAKAIEQGELNLNNNIYKYSASFHTKKGNKTIIKNLLFHTSGFPAWKPLYFVTKKTLFSSLINIISEYPAENPVNARVTYSDLNFITLGYVLEKIYGKTLDEIARTEIFEPLNFKNTFYNPPKELRKRIAASEKGNEFEKNTCTEAGYLDYTARPHAEAKDSDKFRDYQIWGEVHDGNCYFMDGVSGHAGLFSTAEEIFKIALQFLANQTTLLKPETCKLFRTNFTPGLNEARSFAFQLAETKDSTASLALSKDSFGHLGFTGTSLWIEPKTERIFILLTNRTHARELPFVNINSVRRRFHELATEILNAQ